MIHKETGKVWWGNQQIRSEFRDRPDMDNNIEIIRLENPMPGEYTIRIMAKYLQQEGPIDFAIAVTGDSISSIIEVT